MVAKRLSKDLQSHTDDILWLWLNDTRKLAASGQIGQKPYVYVWDWETGEMRTQMRLEMGSIGVTSITFSPGEDSSFVACLDASDDHNLHIFQIRDGKFIQKLSSNQQKKFDLDWGKTSAGENVIGVAGLKQIMFLVGNKNNFDGWQFRAGDVKSAYRTDYLCIGFTSKGDCLAGTSSGKLYLFKQSGTNYSFKQSINAHTKAINWISIDENYIFTGSWDRKIGIWSQKLKKLKEIVTDGRVWSVDCQGGSLLYSLATGLIIK